MKEKRKKLEEREIEKRKIKETERKWIDSKRERKRNKDKIERERRTISQIISASDLGGRGILDVFLGSLLIVQRWREREKGGPSFVFAEMSLLSRHFACCLESSQSKMLSPSQRGHPDAGSSCSGAQEPSKSSLGG